MSIGVPSRFPPSFQSASTVNPLSTAFLFQILVRSSLHLAPSIKCYNIEYATMPLRLLLLNLQDDIEWHFPFHLISIERASNLFLEEGIYHYPLHCQ